MNFENYANISFPSLGLELNPPRGIDIGNFSIRFYGLLIAIGLILAVVYALKRRKQFGFTEDSIMDGVLCIVPFAIICARLYYCAFSWADYKDNPISILYIWEGGIAIYGSVIGAAIGVVVYSWLRKLNLPALLDLVALGFLIGQAIGRWGNFFNREAFGAATDSFARMGLLNTVTGQVEYVHPTFLYESLWNVVGFVALHFLSKKRQYDGQIALGYVAWYGLGRTFIEGLRQDSLYWGTWRVSQVLAAVTCFIAVGVLLFNLFRKHDRAKLFVYRNAEALEEEARKLAEKKEKKAVVAETEETFVYEMDEETETAEEEAETVEDAEITEEAETMEEEINE